MLAAALVAVVAAVPVSLVDDYVITIILITQNLFMFKKMTLSVNPVLLSHTRWISHLSAVTHIFSLIFSIFSHFRHLVNAARRFPELVLLPPGLLFQPARR